MQTKAIVFTLIVHLLQLRHAQATVCTGCLELDELTFDKVLSKFSTVLVKFDIAYPYGEKHENFAKFAADNTVNQPNFAVAVVGIKDYGDKENSNLGERFKIGDKYPVIKLFRNGDTENSIDYPKDLEITSENLRQFVRRHSDIYIPLKGCVQRFDQLAIDFIRGSSEDFQKKINQAELELADLEDETEKQSGKFYILFMKRIQEKGLSFVETENGRLQHLLSGKISNTKRAEINQKLNILAAFKHEQQSGGHSEL